MSGVKEKGEREGEGSQFSRRISQEFLSKLNSFEQKSQPVSTDDPTRRISFNNNSGKQGSVKKVKKTLQLDQRIFLFLLYIYRVQKVTVMKWLVF